MKCSIRSTVFRVTFSNAGIGRGNQVLELCRARVLWQKKTKGGKKNSERTQESLHSAVRGTCP